MSSVQNFPLSGVWSSSHSSCLQLVICKKEATLQITKFPQSLFFVIELSNVSVWRCWMPCLVVNCLMIGSAGNRFYRFARMFNPTTSPEGLAVSFTWRANQGSSRMYNFKQPRAEVKIEVYDFLSHRPISLFII